MEEEYTLDQIRDMIIDFKNDPNSQRLENFYYSKSFSEILGVSRREMSHSSFISWLLNNSESHNLGNFPIRKFLDIIIKFSNDKLKNNIELYNSLITEDYKIDHLSVENEKVLEGSKKRLDIYVDFNLTLSSSDQEKNIRDNQKHVKLVIENKVEAKEHGDQTNYYFEHFSKIKDKGTEIIYIYLTPISTLDLLELEEPECACKEFIQLNYQALVDYLIEPALKQNVSDITKHILNEYLISLSQPSIEEDKNKHKKELIMALGNEERKLLTSFWEKNEKLILAALYAISSDPEQEDETREDIKNALSSLSKPKDYTKYNFKGQKLGKNRLVLAVIKDFTEKNPGLTYEDLKKEFPDKLQGSETFTTLEKAKQKKGRRNFTKKHEIIRLSDETIAVSTQWGIKNIDRFIKHCRKKGYEIQEAK